MSWGLNMHQPSLRAAVGVLLSFCAIGRAAQSAEAAASSPASPLDVVESRMRADVEAGKPPSVAYALIRDGQIVREGGFGMADRERAVAATAHTPYPLASVTKPLVATAVMMLAQRGEIDLAQPAARYLPAAAQGVPGNIRQLLGHTSGLSTYVRIGWAGASPAVPAAGTEPWPYAFAAQPPGTLFEYANLGYGVLGRVVEARSGRPLGEFLRSELFVPLGMRDSSMPDRFAAPAGAAAKLDAAGKALPPTWNDTPGAGNAYSSAHDLALFAAFHLSPAPSELLSADSRQRMQNHVEPGARYDYYGGARYGLGWNVRDEPSGERVVWHEGGMPGASTIVYMLPKRHVAAVVLINQADANETAQRYAQALVQAIEPGFAGAPLVATEGLVPYAGGADLRGRWRGDILIDGHLLPLSLSFVEDGTLTVDGPGATGSTPHKQVRGPLVRDGLVLGAFEGSLPAAGATSGAGHYVLLRLLRHGDRITGALVAFSCVERLEYLLPYAVRLQRQLD
jgi:CubicO group peptidase (beta-lactamase class C family)